MRALLVGGAEASLAGDVLAERGHATVRAASANDAIEALARGPTPELVVVAACDADTAAQQIRAVRSHVRGERVVLLAIVPDGAVEAALDAGADDAVPSPAPRVHVRAAIAAAERAAGRRANAPTSLDAGYELYFTKNPHPMWFYEVDTLAFVAVNDAAVQKYGWSREELLAMTIKDIRPPEEVGRLLEVTSRVARGLERSDGWRHRARDGRIFHVEIVSYPVRFAGRACELVLALDVSGRVEAERKLEELRAQMALSDRMASIGTLAAGVGHEINNPLTFVLANLAFVQDRLPGLRGDDAAAVSEAVADAVDGARRVRAIAKDLTAFSRADDVAGPVDLARVVQSALALAANELKHRAHTVVDVRGAPPALGNEARLGQVLLNLIVNAAQAIPEGDAAGNEVRVTAHGDGARVVLDVSDTGSGVPVDIRPRLFDPFFTTKGVGEGTGLGLWVCRRIISELGGTIELLSTAGRGATFRVTLPAANRPPVASPEPSRSPPDAARSATRRPRVLVVDDEPLVGRALRRALREDADLEVEESSRAALARFARGERFDLVLCDVMMPELPGADLHAALERLDPALARSVVFMTGGAFSTREQEFLAAVPNVCLEKPLDFTRLRALLRAAG